MVPLLALVLGGNSFLEKLFAPNAEPWPYWENHAPANRTNVAHAPWAAFLSTYTAPGEDGIRRVDYGAVTATDQASLGRYINRLTGLTVTGLNRAEQLAYWVNLYNALTVRVVLDHYPVDSIRDIDLGGSLFGDGPWDAELVTVEGKGLSLNDIEHRILRPLWQDPRIHYVVNCASIGCPNLPDRPLTAQTADRVMTRAAEAFINHPRGVAIRDGRLQLSSIYAWFAEDFGTDERTLIAHLKQYARPELRKRLSDEPRFTYAYDWSLNDKN